MSEPTDPFAAPSAGAGQSPPPPSSGPTGYAGQPWGPGPASGHYAPPTQTNTKAIVALCLAIAAYTPVPFIGAVIALVLASSAKREILASGGRQTGLDLCTWATVLSIIHLVFVGLVLLVILPAFILLPFSLQLPFG